jgi:hypothetical protein
MQGIERKCSLVLTQLCKWQQKATAYFKLSQEINAMKHSQAFSFFNMG